MRIYGSDLYGRDLWSFMKYSSQAAKSGGVGLGRRGEQLVLVMSAGLALFKVASDQQTALLVQGYSVQKTRYRKGCLASEHEKGLWEENPTAKSIQGREGYGVCGWCRRPDRIATARHGILPWR